jgi:MFS family permease
LSAVPADDRCPSGIAVAVGAALMVAVAVLGAALTQSAAPRLGGLVLVVAVFMAVFGDGRAALALGVLAGPIGNGFLVNRFGELRWHTRLDGWFVIGLLAAGAVSMIIAQTRREVHIRARIRPFAVLLRDDPSDILPAVVTRSGPSSPGLPGLLEIRSSRTPWERGFRCST